MISEKRQAQALETLQSIIQSMKHPRARSVLQCAGMGALAFGVMMLVYRYSSDQPLFDLTGLFFALVLGGIAGALVRHYFVKAEQEVADSQDISDDRQPGTEQDEPPSEPTTPLVTETNTAQELPEEVEPVVETPVQAPVKEAVAEVSEAELPDVPKQFLMFPDLPDLEEPHEPVHLELPEELAAPAEPDAPNRQDSILPIARHYLSWIEEQVQFFCLALSPDDEILMVNRFMADALGYPEEELSGKGFTETLVPRRLRHDAWTDLVNSGTETPGSFATRSYLLARDGREMPVEWRGTAIFDDAEELSYCFLIGTDLTERERQESERLVSLSHYETLCAETQQNLARVRSILESSIDAMAVFDLQGKATYVNPAFTELFGWTVQDLQDRDSAFVPKDQREIEKPYLDGLGEKGMPCKNLDTKRQCKDGSLVSTRLTASLIRDDQGNQSGVLFTLRALIGRTKEIKEPAKPAPPRQKRQVNAREIAGDIMSGLTDAQLMEKYKLTAKGLHSVFEKLVQAKVIKPSQIVRRSVAYDETVAIELNRIMPADKVKIRPKAAVPPQPAMPVQPVSTEVQGLAKFGLTDDNLDDMVKDLFPGRGSEMATLSQDSLPGTEEVEDVTARRSMQRHYMVVAVPVYQSDDLLTEGTIIDISEQGMKIQGLPSKKGETKSLLVQGDQFHDVFPFVFDAECRWATKDEASGESLAGFQITTISETSLQELRKLVAALSISS
jgi:PAS domain S-box-containing protein